jgi:hypothetical protein
MKVTDVSLRVVRPEDLKPWCPRTEKDGIPSSRRKRKFASAFSFSVDWMTPTHIGDCIFFIQSTNSIQMLISSESILTDSPGNNVLPVIWAYLSQGKLTHGINHYSSIIPCSFSKSFNAKISLRRLNTV